MITILKNLFKFLFFNSANANSNQPARPHPMVITLRCNTCGKTTIMPDKSNFMLRGRILVNPYFICVDCFDKK